MEPCGPATVASSGWVNWDASLASVRGEWGVTVHHKATGLYCFTFNGPSSIGTYFTMLVTLQHASPLFASTQTTTGAGTRLCNETADAAVAISDLRGVPQDSTFTFAVYQSC
jgi:hypothetical protein